MPAIFRIICSSCGHRFEEMDFCALVKADGRRTTLGHPAETEQLEALGTSWEQASAEGKLARFHVCVCQDCGEIAFQRHTVLPDFEYPARPGLWCKTVMYGWAVVLATVVAFADIGVCVKPCVLIVGVVVPMLVIGWVRGIYLRARVRPVAAKADGGSCEQCGSPDLVEYMEYARRGEGKLRCPNCGRRTAEDDPTYMAIA